MSAVASTPQGVLLLVSLMLHAGIAAGIASLPRKPPRVQVVVTLQTVKKPPPPPKPEPPPPPPEPEPPPPPPPPPPPTPPKARPPRPQPQKAAPPPKAGPAAPAAFDTGMTLGSGGSGGFEVPAGGGAPERAAPASAAPGPAPIRKPKPPVDTCSEPIVKAKPLELVQPSYPESERSSGTRGKVRVEIQLDASGGVRSARVIQSLAPAFDEAALKAARRFRFSPATRCGKAVAHKFNLSLRFEL